jgi:ATP-dependent helicase HrpA
MIGHTQPRRIAARAVAERIAEELSTDLGTTVGYAVRFTDRVGRDTRVKVMTDGILLAEMRRDRTLSRYDTIIIDEAHERSLNIDFLLGYLKQLLPRRPDLKLIVTSATIDPQRFADYFDGAPVIEVSGRTYPVEIRYRPIESEDEDVDQVGAICDAVRELWREPSGDVLVFLSGEREIKDTAEALEGLKLVGTDILPLYARLSSAEQHRVFAQHDRRRIVLATNVAETSLTVPGIKYVIDAGTARISRYSNRTKVQLLPIEPISQASAKQRAGRCGRTSDGICVRLYSQDDFDARPVFTDPEILRTNLASVLLQMASLNLGDIEKFGFLDAPDRRQVADGLALLAELGALDADRRLTKHGKQIAQLPVDPRIARMILEADRRGCVREVLVLAAALTIQDPRERPAEAQQAADEKHARFVDKSSDFMTFLNLWKHLREQQRELSSSQFRKMCRAEFLNYLRVREWQDLYSQLKQIASGLGIRVADDAGDRDQIHRALLAGLLSHIGQRDPVRRDYLGARGARFAIFPGSALFRKQPDFVMAAELVETSRLWARVNAGVQSEWAEELADHLVKRSYSEPRWSRRSAAVVATERVTLYGVVLVAGRNVGYHRIDPELSRELFIRHALVEGDWDTRHHFFRDNKAVLAEARDLEERARRRDIVVDDETIMSFYDKRIPPSVVSGRHFDAWWKKARHQTPKLLNLTVEDLVRAESADVTEQNFPDRWSSGSFDLSLTYRFDPSVPEDGITVDLPLATLPTASTAGLDWQVPGLRPELVGAWLRTLPKALRREVVPVPDTAAQLVAVLPDQIPDGLPLTSVLADELRRLRGVVIPPDAWDADRLPSHLRPTYRVIDEQGKEVGRGKDLALLQKQFAREVATTFARATSDVSRDGLTTFDMDSLPRTIDRTISGHEVRGYPALVDGGTSVSVRVLDSAEAQKTAMRGGTRRLLQFAVPPLHRKLAEGLSQRDKLTLSRAPYASPSGLLDDVVAAAIDIGVARAGGPAWTREEFERLTASVSGSLFDDASKILRHVVSTITAAQEVELALTAATAPALKPVADDVRTHLRSLVYDGFVSATPAATLPHLPRYVKALAQRLVDAPASLPRDSQRAAEIAGVRQDLAELRLRPAATADPDAVEAIRWMIEELHVSLFAQKLGTAHAVSVARIHKAMDRIDPR